MDAKQTGKDPFMAIESIISWDDFTQSVNEAGRLAKSEDFDFLEKYGIKASINSVIVPAG